MFENEKATIDAKIRAYLQTKNIDDPKLEFRQIPFSGEWGLALPLFPVAASEARSGQRVIVPKRAQELAEAIIDFLDEPP
jgi:hypothetical protein